jgi:hypothetical protein
LQGKIRAQQCEERESLFLPFVSAGLHPQLHLGLDPPSCKMATTIGNTWRHLSNLWKSTYSLECLFVLEMKISLRSLSTISPWVYSLRFDYLPTSQILIARKMNMPNEIDPWWHGWSRRMGVRVSRWLFDRKLSVYQKLIAKKQLVTYPPTVIYKIKVFRRGH